MNTYDIDIERHYHPENFFPYDDSDAILEYEPEDSL